MPNGFRQAGSAGIGLVRNPKLQPVATPSAMPDLSPARFTPVGGANKQVPVVHAEGLHGGLKGNLPAGIQSHHLNQDATFRDVIPTNEGFAIGIRGNAFTEHGSPHFEFHKSLEGFWSQYRRGGLSFGQRPTNAEYSKAIEDAMNNAGISQFEVQRLSDLAKQNRGNFGLQNSQSVPCIPGR